SKPLCYFCFQVRLASLRMQTFDGLAAPVQRYSMARNALRTRGRRDEFHQEAFIAGTTPFEIAEVDAGWRVLKDRRWLPRSSNGAPVGAVFDEIEFGFENLKNVAIIFFCHGNTSGGPGSLPRQLTLMASQKKPR